MSLPPVGVLHQVRLLAARRDRRMVASELGPAEVVLTLLAFVARASFRERSSPCHALRRERGDEDEGPHKGVPCRDLAPEERCVGLPHHMGTAARSWATRIGAFIRPVVLARRNPQAFRRYRPWCWFAIWGRFPTDRTAPSLLRCLKIHPLRQAPERRGSVIWRPRGA